MIPTMCRQDITFLKLMLNRHMLHNYSSTQGTIFEQLIKFRYLVQVATHINVINEIPEGKD